MGKFIYYFAENYQPMFGNDGMDTVLIFNNYALETIYEIRAMVTIIVGQKQITKHLPKKFLDYYLFDFNKGICTRIDSNQVNLLVKSTFPIAEKKDGIVLKGEIDEVKNELSAFRFTKDTIVDHVTYKLLEIYYPGDPPKDFVKKKTLWLNPQLKSFLFHPVSTTLDKKFGGTILAFIETKTDGKYTVSSGVMGTYKDGLTKSDIQLLKQLIVVTDQVNAEAKK